MEVDLMRRSVEDLDDDDADDTEPEHSLELVHPVVGKVEPEVKSIINRSFIVNTFLKA